MTVKITEEAVDKLVIKDPANPEQNLETFLIVYKVSDGDDGEDIGYRVWLQPGRIHPQEVMFATVDTVARVMAAQENMPLVEALGGKVIEAVENFAKVLENLEKLKEEMNLGSDD